MRIGFIIIALFSCIGSAIAYDGSGESSEKKISVMTWNVKLLPRIATFLKHYPVKRAKIIPTKLIEENADIISLQEAFDRTSLRILRKKLQSVYPYTAGFKNRSGITFKKAGGVIIFSKYPVKELESIAYDNSIGIDKFAKKGALLVEVDHPVSKFQVLGTHMQAGGGKEIKIGQYQQAAALLKRHEKTGVPQFATGDFNTKYADTLLYPKLLQSLEMEDGPISSELKVTSDHLLNDMDSYDPNRRHLIDYVFLKPNGVAPKQVISYRQP